MCAAIGNPAIIYLLHSPSPNRFASPTSVLTPLTSPTFRPSVLLLVFLPFPLISASRFSILVIPWYCIYFTLRSRLATNIPILHRGCLATSSTIRAHHPLLLFSLIAPLIPAHEIGNSSPKTTFTQWLHRHLTVFLSPFNHRKTRRRQRKTRISTFSHLRPINTTNNMALLCSPNTTIPSLPLSAHRQKILLSRSHLPNVNRECPTCKENKTKSEDGGREGS